MAGPFHGEARGRLGGRQRGHISGRGDGIDIGGRLGGPGAGRTFPELPVARPKKPELMPVLTRECGVEVGVVADCQRVNGPLLSQRLANQTGPRDSGAPGVILARPAHIEMFAVMLNEGNALTLLVGVPSFLSGIGKR